MRKILLTMVALFATQFLFAQTCSDLFFSEYIEGSKNNKALEIYNPTSQTINLSDYRIIRWSNGQGPGQLDISLYSVDLPNYQLAPHDVFVAVVDQQDCSLTGQDTCVVAQLRALADGFFSPVYEENSTLYHNGNDAISLNKISDTSLPFGGFVDIFGLIGENPGTSATASGGTWTDTFPYVQSAGGTYYTRDHTLVRKCTIQSGVKQNPGAPYSGAFNPSVQWDLYDEDDFSHLGQHSCACAVDCSTATNEAATSVAHTIAPNPAYDQFTLSANERIFMVEVYNLAGQKVYAQLVNQNTATIVTSSLAEGTYLVKTVFANNTTTFDKVVVR